MRRVSLLLVAVLVLPLGAQVGPSSICQANSNNNNYLSGGSMGGPNLWLAIQITAASTYTATRIEFFTGNSTGLNSVSLWTHDAVTNTPQAMLGQGSWMMAWNRTWQGANLTQPVTLTQGQTYWLMWAPINGAQSSIETNSGGSLLYRGSFNNGGTWNGPFMGPQWKLRIYCGAPGHYEVFGTGCAGVTRTIPRLGFWGIPTVGASSQILLTGGVPNDFALLVVGDSNTASGPNPLPFDLGALGAPGCLLRAAPVATVFTPTDAVTGEAVLSLAIPPNGALAGLRFYNQWFVHDAAANALGFKVSNAGAGIVGL